MKIKNLLILFTLFFSVTAIQAQSTSKMFDKFSNNKDIKSIIVTKAMLSMVSGNNNNFDMNGMNIKGLTNKLDQIEIYTSENVAACKNFREEMKDIQKGKNHELLMSAKDGDQNVNFYAQKEKDIFKELFMFVDQPNQCVIIRLLGNFTSEDIQKITKDIK